MVQGYNDRQHCHAGPEKASGLYLENESMVRNEQNIQVCKSGEAIVCAYFYVPGEKFGI